MRWRKVDVHYSEAARQPGGISIPRASKREDCADPCISLDARRGEDGSTDEEPVTESAVIATWLSSLNSFF